MIPFQPRPVPAPLQDAFAWELRERAAVGVLVVSVIGFILFPTFAVLDWIMYPDQFGALTEVRFTTSAVGFMFLGVQLYFRQNGTAARHARLFTWIFILICSAGLDSIIYLAGGIESPYYAGMVLLLIAIIVGLPWSLFEMAVLLLTIVAQFNLAMLLPLGIESWQLVTNANFFLLSTIAIGLFGSAASYNLRVQEFLGRRAVEEEKTRNEELLLKILPDEVAEELKQHGRVEARNIDSCTILFSDFVGFTAMSEKVSPESLVKSLDQAFRAFDRIMVERGLEKLKTVGDAYMSAGGVLDSQPDHLVTCVLTGLQMIDELELGDLRRPDGKRWTMRVGIHTGPVVAGVIGDRKFAYDLWGDTVNTASRMESTARPHTVNMLAEVYQKIETFFVGEDRGFIPVRGKGPLAMARVHRLRPEFSADEQGRQPNDLFFAELERWLEAEAEKGGATPHPFVPSQPMPAISDVRETLSNLREEDLGRLDQVADLLEIPEGRVLIEEGQELDVLFLITEGLFGVRMARSGVDIELVVLGAGEIVGELSFLSLEPASATVVALTDSVVRRFDLKSLEEAENDHTGFSSRLFHSFSLILAQRIREANARLFSIDHAWGDTLEQLPHAWSRGDLDNIPPTVVSAVRDLQDALRLHRESAWEMPREPTESIPPHASPALVHDIGDALIAACHGVAPERRAAAGAFVSRETWSHFMRSELLRRGLLSTRNQSSDAILLSSILREQPPSSDPMGQVLDRWFLQQPLARGIRASVHQVAAELDRRLEGSPGRMRVTLLSSSSAPELFLAMERSAWTSRLQFTCVDPDVETLSQLGARVAELGRTDQFTFVARDIFQHPSQRTALRLIPQHLVVLPRFATPIDDTQLLALLNELHGLLVNGGTLLLGLVSIPDDWRTFYEHTLLSPVGHIRIDHLQDLVARSRFGASAVEPLHGPDEGATLVALHRLRR